MVMSPPRLWPLTDCSTNYKPVLSSERAPQDKEQRKKKSNIWSWAPKGCPTPRHTGWLTVSRKVTSTSARFREIVVFFLLKRLPRDAVCYVPVLIAAKLKTNNLCSNDSVRREITQTKGWLLAISTRLTDGLLANFPLSLYAHAWV
jgi:hypothetical protein